MSMDKNIDPFEVICNCEEQLRKTVDSCSIEKIESVNKSVQKIISILQNTIKCRKEHCIEYKVSPEIVGFTNGMRIICNNFFNKICKRYLINLVLKEAKFVGNIYLGIANFNPEKEKNIISPSLLISSGDASREYFPINEIEEFFVSEKESIYSLTM